MRRIILVVFSAIITLNAVSADPPENVLVLSDLAPNNVTENLYNNGPYDEQWDLLFYTNVQQTVIWQLCLGVDFGGGHFFVTDGGASTGMPPNYYHLLNPDGSLDSTFAQPTSSGWGWRDPAFDGSYFYCGWEADPIYAIDTLGNLAPSHYIPKPSGVAVVRALAYDPSTDHFWTGNFADNIVEFDRQGNVLWQGNPAPLQAIYGMAWDDAAPNGPWLWIYDQGGGCTFHQYDPVNHVYTGVSYTVPLLPGLTAQIAGGCGFTNQWDPDYWTLVVLAQGTPWDYVYTLEMYPTSPLDVFIALTPTNPPITIPPTGGSFSYNATVANDTTTTITFDAWIMVRLPDQSWYDPVLGPLSLTLPGNTSITRLRTQTVPASAPAGEYWYEARVGDYPNAVWDTSGFAFTKLGDSGQAGMTELEGFSDWICTGEDFGEIEPQLITHNSSLMTSSHPNPFNATTAINYELRAASLVRLKVFDITGRVVATLVDDYREAGAYEVTFDGRELVSGVYLVRLEMSGSAATPTTEVQKIVLMK